MNVIAHPCFFETVRFPTQDKSETLSLFQNATLGGKAKIVKPAQKNNISR